MQQWDMLPPSNIATVQTAVWLSSCQRCLCCQAQTATVYSDANGVQPKEYNFKVQHVRGKQGHEERKTVGKVKVDLSTFCTEEPSPVPQEVFLQLK